MAIFKCKMCGGALEVQDGVTVCECEYCGTKQTLPRLNDEKKTNLYDRANHFRRNNEFDKAMSIYEQILNEDTSDAEAYWSLVLCKYGIEYVDDPATRKKVPTVNRAQFTSIFADEDYKSAIANADTYQKSVYEDEAKAIDEIQKGILAISEKEEPFDVFICYKETDNNGRRTPDSVLATELYNELTREGFKVFFARITLEDKLGTAYEPYIFAALNSSKVMVVLGTKPEHFNAVWVKNEWSRYLSLIKNGARKMLIPAYKDMDPYDLPEEFSHLQAQDMSKLGFMHDLVHGIKKIAKADEPKKQETVVINQNQTAVAPLLKRAFIFLEDKDWDSADEYAEKVLDQDPENAQAYLVKLMAELQISKQNDLKNCDETFDDNANYDKICRYDSTLGEQLKADIDFINERNENARIESLYQKAVDTVKKAYSEQEYKDAAKSFDEIIDYKDSKKLKEQCFIDAENARKRNIYQRAIAGVSSRDVVRLNQTISLFESIPDYKDSNELLEKAKQRIDEVNKDRIRAEKLVEERRIRAEKEAEEQRIREEKLVEERRIAAKKKAKKTKMIAIMTLVILIVAVMGIVKGVQNANTKAYASYMSMLENGEYENASKGFGELSYKYNFENSRNMKAICDCILKLKNRNDETDYYSIKNTLEANSNLYDVDKYISYCSGMTENDINKAIANFEKSNGLYDSKQLIEFLKAVQKYTGKYTASNFSTTHEFYDGSVGFRNFKNIKAKVTVNDISISNSLSCVELKMIITYNVIAGGEYNWEEEETESFCAYLKQGKISFSENVDEKNRTITEWVGDKNYSKKINFKMSE